MENRKIKFRAWDGNEMHYKVCINHEGKAIKYSYRSTDWVDDANAGIPMQFTGLHDKNGKEIYEGDYFHYTAHVGYLINSFIGEVVWHQTGWAYKGRSTTFHLPNMFSEHDELKHDFLDHLEIIGNVFEHPELTSQTK